ncbi:hypothetical protein D0Y65_043372 [Glycine soja]|uniref:DDE Tnp4 domain-containing protein n=1 Tax=Glycine soja TaxID=3848 RepID=A0A445GHA7_GLYSO|nr:hypothetical protein D0Y65_043372 [Glycine soja]
MKVQAEGGGLFRYESAANMLEGGGKTLILNPMELEEIGFKIVVYLFSLIGLYSVDSKEMESNIVDGSTASRKRKRDEEEEEELEQTFFIIVNVTTMILGALTWYHDKSTETISKQIKNVLRAIMKVSKEYLKFHDYNLEGSVEIKWRWFKNSIGALDGIHIPVTVTAEDRPRYHNRKGDIFTNVLGACGPNLRFIYVLPGWEGSAGDSRVFSNFVQAFWSSPHGNNVKNHFKLWRTWYGIVSDILSQSGFDWDSTKYMITIENEIAWNEYVKDRATGLGAENALDADDIMSKETNEEETIHTVSFDLIKFRHKKKHFPK